VTDLYIHIGTHKTGSTSIQHALKNIGKQSLDEGWRFIKNPKIMKCLSQSTKYDKGLVSSYRDELDSLVSSVKSTKKIIVSSEHYSGIATDGYQNSGIIASMLRDATSKYKVKIIIYLRRQDDFVESMYTQMIHQGGTLEFDCFLKGFDSLEALDYQRMLNDYSLSFGRENIIVRSYHEASRRGLLNDFSEIIVSDLLKKSTSERSNPSYSSHALEIAKKCNQHLDTKQQSRLRRALQRVMIKNNLDDFLFFSNEDRLQFQEKYNNSNRCVADQYFNLNGESLFTAPKIPTNDRSTDKLQYEEVAKLIVDLLQIKGENRI
jgi:hypothetical protein